MRQQAAGHVHSSEATDSGLLQVAREQHPGAWERLVDRYSSLIYHWCRRSGLGPEDAADVLQSVMLKVAQYLPRFEKDDRPAAFRRWLATLTRTCITDLIRANHGQPHGAGGTDALARLNSLPSPCDTGSSVAAAVESRHWELDEVLAEVEQTVETTTWDAFRLTVLENLTSTEAGDRLQISPAAVRLAKARVLQKLRGRMENGNPAANARDEVVSESDR